MIYQQAILSADNDYSSFVDYLLQNRLKKIMIVCGSSFHKFALKKVIDRLSEQETIDPIYFSDFHPNPDYESVVKGVKLFRDTDCDSILAIGGGSAMDVAKCIKLYAKMPEGANYLKEEIIPNDIHFIAVPTTAGTGSEATRYAVIYYNGEKQSITHSSGIPQAVLFDTSVLLSLPDYQRKATMLDAFCHAVESFWSVNSNDESLQYSKEAISLILNNIEGYVENKESGNAAMLRAANLAGKAINITQTTAGHAMCYKITKMYDVSHGHAAALCVNVLWHFMAKNTQSCSDSRGQAYLEKMFKDLAQTMGCTEAIAAADKFQTIFNGLNLPAPKITNEKDFDLLTESVNPVRLKNNPIKLEKETISTLYHLIFNKV